MTEEDCFLSIIVTSKENQFEPTEWFYWRKNTQPHITKHFIFRDNVYKKFHIPSNFDMVVDHDSLNTK